MRRLLAIALVLALGGCVTEAMPDGGVAAYDTLKAAKDACQAKGRVFRLKRGGNSQYLEDYACGKE